MAESHERTADPHFLRFGQDDKGKGGSPIRILWWMEWTQILPLRCAPVRMTKGRAASANQDALVDEWTADPSTSLRFESG